VVEVARRSEPGLYKRRQTRSWPAVYGVRASMESSPLFLDLLPAHSREKKLRTYLFRLSPLAGDETATQTLLVEWTAIMIGNGYRAARLQGLVAGLAWGRGWDCPFQPVLWGLVMAVAPFFPWWAWRAVVVPRELFYLWFAGRHAVAVGFFIFCMD